MSRRPDGLPPDSGRIFLAGLALVIVLAVVRPAAERSDVAREFGPEYAGPLRTMRRTDHVSSTSRRGLRQQHRHDVVFVVLGPFNERVQHSVAFQDLPGEAFHQLGVGAGGGQVPPGRPARGDDARPGRCGCLLGVGERVVDRGDGGMLSGVFPGLDRELPRDLRAGHAIVLERESEQEHAVVDALRPPAAVALGRGGGLSLQGPSPGGTAARRGGRSRAR
ncbi:hypothetical protein [Streptomyces coelicolor A3(2)]|uniref:Uncharacterized protein n=2 Tax=Streptomyces coelicolor TaxID=1902 RepID=Q9AD71_STRCO|nr:hypothetical protein [Streptomyces coelicolor]CAC36599.1 hypothetical protein [Streptomyces coelicolor A3(2)]